MRKIGFVAVSDIRVVTCLRCRDLTLELLACRTGNIQRGLTAAQVVRAQGTLLLKAAE